MEPQEPEVIPTGPDMSLPIGIASNAPGAGKSTLAGQMGRVRDGFRVSFAQPIRDMLEVFLDYLGLPKDLLYDRKDEPIEALGGKTGRDLMISLGTAWGRQMVAEDIWVRIGMRAVGPYSRPITFDDVRFPEEAQAIKAAGGHLVYLIGPQNPTGSLAEGKVRPEDCDVVIHNDHTRSPYLLAIDTLYNIYGTPTGTP